MPSKPEFLECDSCLCFAARRAARAITQHFDRHLRGSGLRATQFTLLVMLARAGELPVTALAERLGMERTTLTRNLRLLLAKRLVSMEEGEDRRVKRIAIAPPGLAIVRAALPQWRKAQKELSRRLPAGAFQVLSTAGHAA